MDLVGVADLTLTDRCEVFFIVWPWPNSTVISQIWQLPLHFQAVPSIFIIILLENDYKSK